MKKDFGPGYTGLDQWQAELQQAIDPHGKPYRSAEEIYQQLSQDFDNGIITVNERRAALNLPPFRNGDVPKDKWAGLLPIDAYGYLVGDYVTRDGTDIQLVKEIDDFCDTCGTFVCVVAPKDNWCAVGEEEFNLCRRYSKIDYTPEPIIVSSTTANV